MEATLNYRKNRQSKKEPKLTFSQWVLKTIKRHKKRTTTDATLGLIITAALFLINLV
ncbi:hypothetical protein GCM10010954_21270 [Halobacillus andaensis]|uniref:Uncharacterized protein n=1 Tax=Halobacillus andaensis TaxID=1176239 RepID=A0A917B4W2_HALAA|nr:hypothetical protein [Halobacillus andaensis]MBP2004367.1 hypothetical protein [Halobacillus andaensis]GGF22147.1 hypothetical protein GCM10010954_21270 [Halobacillus andaensis]